jgi:hypothetical protein
MTPGLDANSVGKALICLNLGGEIDRPGVRFVAIRPRRFEMRRKIARAACGSATAKRWRFGDK